MQPGWRPSSGVHTVAIPDDMARVNSMVKNWMQNYFFPLPDPNNLVPPYQHFELEPLNRRKEHNPFAALDRLLEDDEDEAGDEGGPEQCLVYQDKWTQKTFMARNAAGLDSCCSKTIMGTIWQLPSAMSCCDVLI